MSFGRAVRTCFSKFVGWEGRASRAEYWWFQLLYLLVTLVAIVVAVFAPRLGTVLYLLSALILFLPSLAVTVRRLHDTGRSGWTYWVGVIPLVGWIVVLVFLVQAGDRGGNRYGYGASGVGLPSPAAQLPLLPAVQPGRNWCENIACRRYRISSAFAVCDQCGGLNLNQETFGAAQS